MKVIKTERLQILHWLMAAVAAVILTACGGSSNSTQNDPTNPQASSVACDGTRAWDFGLDPGDTTKTLISEGGATFDVPSSSKTPCAVYWEVNEAQTCSLIFTAEDWFTQFTNLSAPPNDLTLSVQGNNLNTSASGESSTGTLSSLTTAQLQQLPDC